MSHKGAWCIGEWDGLLKEVVGELFDGEDSGCVSRYFMNMV